MDATELLLKIITADAEAREALTAVLLALVASEPLDTDSTDDALIAVGDDVAALARRVQELAGRIRPTAK